MPSRRHQLLAYAVPRVRRSRELVDEPTERARVEQWQQGLDRSLPTRLVPGFDRRFSVVTEELPAGFPVHVVTPRHVEPRRTLFHVHGGGFMSPVDPFHVRFVARLAGGARRAGRRSPTTRSPPGTPGATRSPR